MSGEKWTANAVWKLLQKRYPAPAFALLPQVRNGTGFRRKRTRTADAIAASLFPSRGLHLTGFEVKVSRSDWLKELADPAKADSIAQYCRYWYVVAPTGVIDLGEVPETWGYLECKTLATMREAKPAPKMDETPVDMLFVGAVLRKVHEVTVPFEEVRDKINDAVSTAQERERDNLTHKIERLEKMVRDFTEASGVTLNEWSGGHIGEAVKFVMESGVDGVEKRIRYLRTTASEILRDIDRRLEMLPQESDV